MFFEVASREAEVMNNSRKRSPAVTPEGTSDQSGGTRISAEQLVSCGIAGVASTGGLGPEYGGSSSSTPGASAGARIEPPFNWIDPQSAPLAQRLTPSESKSPVSGT